MSATPPAARMLRSQGTKRKLRETIDDMEQATHAGKKLKTKAPEDMIDSIMMGLLSGKKDKLKKGEKSVWRDFTDALVALPDIDQAALYDLGKAADPELKELKEFQVVSSPDVNLMPDASLPVLVAKSDVTAAAEFGTSGRTYAEVVMGKPHEDLAITLDGASFALMQLKKKVRTVPGGSYSPNNWCTPSLTVRALCVCYRSSSRAARLRLTLS